MGGPGSGRRPKVPANGVNGHAHASPALGPRVTFGDLFGKITPAAPAPAPKPDLPSPIANPTPAPAHPLAAPPTTAAPPERSGNRSFADMAAYVSVNVGVAVIGDRIRKGGHEPRDVPAEDLDRTTKATSDAIVRGLGDMEVPWWAGLATAWGNLFLAMRVGAKPLKNPDAPETTTTAASSPATGPITTPPPPAPSPLGQVTERQRPRAPDLTRMPADIPVSA